MIILNWLLSEFALSKEEISDISEAKVKDDIIFMFVVFKDHKLTENIIRAYSFNPSTYKCIY